MGSKARVLLINPNAQVDELWKSEPYLPNGLLYIAAVLEKSHCDVRIYDRNIKSNRGTDEEIESFSPDVGGVSVLTGKCIIDAIEVSKYIKECYPDILIVWGGVHPTLLPEQVLSEHYVDIVVRGDGEYTMEELVQKVKAGKSFGEVLGISYKDKGGSIRHNSSRPLIQNLDRLPDPAWHLVQMDHYPIISLNTSRGCPFRCTFCYNQGFNQGQRCELNAGRIVNQIQHLRMNYGVRHVKFFEDNFTMNKKRVEEFCKLLITEKMGITWECEARADSLRKELLEKMARSGCVYIGIGAESGSPRILKFLRKGITVEQVERMCRMCIQVGIGAYVYVMGGLPTETREDFNMTLEFLRRVPRYQYELMIYRPYPGTELYDYCVREGLFKSPERLMDWARICDLHSAENSIGQVPYEVLTRQLSRNQRDNIFSRVHFYLRTNPFLLLRKLFSPWRLTRFIRNLLQSSLRIYHLGRN